MFIFPFKIGNESSILAYLVITIIFFVFCFSFS
jgi:hypothetical protein